MKNKEEIYDEKISPLMGKIIEICQQEGIAMISSYSIPTEEDEGLQCTTHLRDGDDDAWPSFAEANRIIRSGTTEEPPMMITTEGADGSKTMTAIFG